MKVNYFSILFIVTLLLSACNKEVAPKEDMRDIYTVVLDSIMEIDDALNHEMEFIAIDMSNFKDVNNQDEEKIINYFKEKYKTDVMDATFEELEEKGFYNPDTLALDGILLRIEKVEIKNNHMIFFEGSKFRSGKGAIGVEITVHYKDGEWLIKESEETWIS